MATQQTKEVTTVKEVRDLLQDNQAQLVRLLPKVITPQRFMAVVVNVIQDDTDLQKCTANSLVRCIFQSALLGLTPGLRRQSYLVPFYNSKKGRHQAQLLIGYQGLLDLARRTGEILKVDAQEVYDGDIFRYSNGYDDTLVHEPKSVHRDIPSANERWQHISHFYAWVKLKNGERQKVVMTRKQIEGHRDKWSKAKDSGPWKTSPIEMGQKTVLRELCNLLPSADEEAVLMKAVSLDRQLESDHSQTYELTDFTVEDDPDIEGGDHIESRPTQSGSAPRTDVEGPKLPDYGPAKNKRMNDPDVTLDHLKYYLGIKTRDLGKPGREQFDAADRQMIKDIEGEIQRRGGVVKEQPIQEASTVEQTQKPTDKKAAAPKKEEPSSDEYTEDQWMNFLQQTTVHKDYAPHLGALKREYKIKSVGELPIKKRKEFFTKYNQRVTGAGLAAIVI